MGDYDIICAEAKDKAACEAQAAADEAAHKKKADATTNAYFAAHDKGKSEAPPAPAPDKPSKQITESEAVEGPKKDTPSKQITESKAVDGPAKDKPSKQITESKAVDGPKQDMPSVQITESKPPDMPMHSEMPSPQITESKPPPSGPSDFSKPWKPGDKLVPPAHPHPDDDKAFAQWKKDQAEWNRRMKLQNKWDMENKTNEQAKSAVADTPTKDTKAVTNTQAADASASATATGKDSVAANKAEANAAQDAKVAKGSAPAVNDGVLSKPGATAEEAGKTGNTPPPPPPKPKQTIPKPTQGKFDNWPNPAKMLESNISIDILSVPTGIGVSFGAFVTSYTDSYKCNWNSVNASGRMDPIQTFQNTQRVISIEWDVVAGSLMEAWENLDKCQRLVQMMYPTWASGGKEALASSLNSPPYFKFKFANLASSGVGPSGNSGGPGSAAKASGLFGTVAGVDVAPDFDQGVYVSGGSIYPKLVSLNLEITVLHDHQLGYPKGLWTDPSHVNFLSFPYQMSSEVVKMVGTAAAERGVDQALEARDEFNQHNAPGAADPEAANAIAAGDRPMTDLEVENHRRAEAGLDALPTQLSKAQQAEANKTMQDTNL